MGTLIFILISIGLMSYFIASSSSKIGKLFNVLSSFLVKGNSEEKNDLESTSMEKKEFNPFIRRKRKNKFLKENKILIGIILSAFIVGTFLYMALKSQQSSSVVDNVTQGLKDSTLKESYATFYIKSEIANVRKCPALSCWVVGQYSQNTPFQFPYGSISSMPEWLEISWQDKDNKVSIGYMNKTVFSVELTKFSSQQNRNVRFYIKSEFADVYECPSLSCAVPAHYSQNDWFEFPAGTILNNLSEWVQISWFDEKGNNGVGYIQKSKFSSVPIKSVDLPSPQPFNVSQIVNLWYKSVGYVMCDNDVSGSGTLLKDSLGQYIVLSNYHVVEDTNCSIVFSTDISQGFKQSLWFDVLIKYKYPEQDAIQLSIVPFSTKSTVSLPQGMTAPQSLEILKQIANNNLCSNRPNIGDEVIILGYPGIGSQTGITVTRGIISGYEKNYYITDAKIDHGNSGGAAIWLDHNCYLGIPSAAKVGSIESLGRILDFSRYAVPRQ